MAKTKQAVFTAVRIVSLWASKDRDSLLHPDITVRDTDWGKKEIS